MRERRAVKATRGSSAKAIRDGVSRVQKPDYCLIVVGDLHLSHKAPLARSAEEDWLRTQRGYLEQLRALQLKHCCAIAYCGDLFDGGWQPHQCPPALINFALEHLPQGYAVPGNHDLPNHRLDEIKRSAFWTLVRAGKLFYLEPDRPLEISGFQPIRLHGFPLGHKVRPLASPNDFFLEVAVVHDYIWTRNTGYHDAPEEHRYKAFRSKVGGYDLAAFGDNHIPFEINNVVNVGSFMRRKADERDHHPSVGLVRTDGEVHRHHLDTSQDKFLEVESLIETLSGIGAASFIEELTALGDSAISFADAICEGILKRKKVPEEVKEIVRRALEGTDK